MTGRFYDQMLMPLLMGGFIDKRMPSRRPIYRGRVRNRMMTRARVFVSRRDAPFVVRATSGGGF